METEQAAAAEGRPGGCQKNCEDVVGSGGCFYKFPAHQTDRFSPSFFQWLEGVVSIGNWLGLGLEVGDGLGMGIMMWIVLGFLQFPSPSLVTDVEGFL